MLSNEMELFRRALGLIAMITTIAFLTTGSIYAAEQPNSGSIIDQVNQSQPTLPKKDADDVKVPEIPSSTSSENGKQVKIHVQGFRLVGTVVLPEKELLGQVEDEAGQDLSLNELYGVAEQITKYLRKKGYIVAFAYIPAQKLEDGVVSIAVVPGQYGEIRINNNARIGTERLQKMTSVLNSGSIITQSSLERVLLLMNDLAGVSIKATLAPGKAPGTADLTLDVEDTHKLIGGINSNNSGNDYTGRYIGGVQLYINDFTHNGDQLSLNGLDSGSGLINGGVAYEIPISSRGLRLGFNYSGVHYELGKEFDELDATGYARISGCELTYPFIRSRTSNIYGVFGFDYKRLNDEIGSADMSNTRTDKLWRVGINGDAIDTWGGGGSNSYALTCSIGDLKITDDIAAALDSITAQTDGRFVKMSLNYNRLQYIAPSLTLNLRLNGQLANGNLDSSEKLFLGGADGVRAYGQGSGSGDQGMLLSTELRWRLPGTHLGKNSVYLTGFLDYGDVTFNIDPWPGSGDNHKSLKGAGIGFIWNLAGYTFRCDYARAIDAEGRSDDDDHHLWARFAAYF
ncbi:MAG TPA: ShlB/FhaC/HecB family hemolysin secretion/activation protein [Bacillota bacterium]|nr:ShlB/FhaC/HecB family hemolysin secretion/activation protein [Bacillota bacterium]